MQTQSPMPAIPLAKLLPEPSVQKQNEQNDWM